MKVQKQNNLLVVIGYERNFDHNFALKTQETACAIAFLDYGECVGECVSEYASPEYSEVAARLHQSRAASLRSRLWETHTLTRTKPTFSPERF